MWTDHNNIWWRGGVNSKWYSAVLWPWAGTLGLTNNHTVKLWIEAYAWCNTQCQCVSGGPEWLSVSDNQAAARTAVLMLHGDASAAVQNSCIVFCVSSACVLQQQSEKSLVATYVTAYCAKDRYSTSTSRPLLSSFKNSLTHLKTQRHLAWQQFFSAH